MFAPIYTCPKCGDVWHVQIIEDINTEHDEIYRIPICENCNSEVFEKMEDGIPVLHALTPEEMDMELNSNYCDDEYFPDDDDEYG